MNGIEVVNGVPVDWSKFKSVAKGMHLKKSKENYVNILKLMHKNNHNLLSEYKSNKDKILIEFNCGHKPHWIRSDSYKRGGGCPECNGKYGNRNRAREEFVSLVERNGHKLLGEYVNSMTKVLIDFNCGHKPQWITPYSYKRGHKCYECFGNISRSEMSKKQFNNLVYKNNHNLLSEYVGNRAKVLIDFNCGHEPHWISPDHYKKGRRCPKCSNRCPKQAKNNFMDMLKENGHKLLSKYVNVSTKVLVDFNCGHKPHWISPSDYRRGHGCPLCKNKGENALYNLLADMGCEIEIQKTYEKLRDVRLLPYDFYLPKYNLLIELDGGHHRKQVKYTSKNMTELERDMADIYAEIRFYDRQRKDKLKDEYAKVNNIPLLRIEYNSKIELDKWKQLILDKIEEIESGKIA